MEHGFVKVSGLGSWWQAGVFLEVLQSPFSPTFWSGTWCSAGWPPAPFPTLFTERETPQLLLLLPSLPFTWLLFKSGILE